MKITRGETPTFKVYLPSSVTADDLGDPHVAIAQNITLIEPNAYAGEDANGEYVSFTITEEESLRLVSGQNAFFQITWKKTTTINNTTTTNIVKGAMHRFWVSDSLIEVVE